MSVGCLVGLDDRNIRGFKLGADIGNAVGNICGCCVGRRFKGRTVGRNEGCLVGHAKGCLEGVVTGSMDGAWVGGTVGKEEGFNLG